MKSRASDTSKVSPTDPSGPTPIERITRPFQEFSETDAAGGALLLSATMLALASPWAESYSTLWEHKFTIAFEGFALSKSVLHWIKDGLMAIFFFVVGLETSARPSRSKATSFAKLSASAR